tara:strand:+ start:22 stop:1509 length:1488 start_codon:yes stop_codon:yes gene_type:complete
MSQYSGNKTNGAFTPGYAPEGETKDPINVVSTSMEVGGETITGYQATYANGTSKWTAQVHTDGILEGQRFDHSTFTGKKESDGSWTWTPTSDNSFKNLANDYKGPDGEKISAESIETTFYNKQGVTAQQKMSGLQALALIENKGGIENLRQDGRFANLPGIQGTSTSDITQTNQDGTVDPDISSVDITTAIKSTKVRREYGNYYYPYDLSSNKQDRIIFKMKESTGKIIDPSVKNDVKAFQRKATSIQGSVTLPITAGIKDSNMVDWGRSMLDPLQAFGAATVMNMGEAAFQKGPEGAMSAFGNAMEKGKGMLAADTGARTAVNAWIAGQAVGTKNLLSRATGAIANPNMELLFRAPGLRAFDFTFQMSPRDAKEAAEVKSIINFFKQGMSVKTTTTNVFLKAPNYFEVDYVTFDDNGEMKQHPSISIIKTCALLTCSVDYTPNNSYMTYSDESRSMVSYTMNLQLGELDPILESDYYDGLGMQDSTANSTRIGY